MAMNGPQDSGTTLQAPGNGEDTLRRVVGGLPDHGGAPAIIGFETGEADAVSFADLSERIARRRGELLGRGLGKGDRVAIAASNGPCWIEICLAVVDAGAVAVPVDASLDKETLAHVLSDADPALVFADDRRRDSVETALKGNASVLGLDADPDAGATDGAEARVPALRPEDEALLFYTSGTTGPPKGVPLSHANLLFELDRLLEMDLMRQGERLLLPLPLHHVYPFVVGLLAPLLYGVGVVLPRSLTGPDMQTAMQEGAVNGIIGVPRLYETLVDGIERQASQGGWLARQTYRAMSGASLQAHRRFRVPLGRLLMRPARRRVAPELRLLVSGGAALGEDLAWRLDSFGWTVATGYGLTETSPMLTVLPPGDRHFASAGKPVDGVELRIAPAEENGADTEEDGAGEILARGPNVFAGYRGLPDKTEDAFTADGWFRTEDRGRIDGEGYLHILGRSSLFVVTEAGENISLEELEKSYETHPLIREIGILMHEGRLSAVVVPDPAEMRNRGVGKAGDAVAEAVKEHARDLPRYKRILDIEVAGDSLPRTLIGKIRRAKLEERFLAQHEGRESGETGPIPVDEMSEDDRALLQDPSAGKVWEMLAERFKAVRLTPDSSMAVDLDVDSLEWVSLTLDIRDRTGVELAEAQTAEIETVRDLLEAVRDASETPGENSGDVLETPEKFLSDADRDWLRPLGRGEQALAWTLYWINRGLMRAVFRLRVEGLENVRAAEQVAVLPNHASYLDGFVVMAALPFDFVKRAAAAGSAELAFRTPVHRAVMRLSRALPVQGNRAALSSLALPLMKLREGSHLVWFPEGRRSRDGELLPVRPGIGMLLAREPVTVVPTLIDGAYEAMPLGQALPRPRKITVRFGEPASVEELSSRGEGDEPRERIAHAIGERLAAMKSSLAA